MSYYHVLFSLWHIALAQVLVHSLFWWFVIPHWDVSFIRAGTSSDLFTTEFSDLRIVPSSSQEVLSKHLLNSFNKSFVIGVLYALSLVHCRHSLSIYARMLMDSGSSEKINIGSHKGFFHDAMKGR